MSWRNEWRLAAVVVFVLAVGIGADLSIFSAFDAVLLRSLPVARPDQIYFARNLSRAQPDPKFAYAVFSDLRQASADVQWAAFTTPYVFFTPVKDASPQPVRTQLVSSDFFSLLGTRAVRGRLLGPGDERGTGVVLRYGWWQRHSRPAVGSVIVLNQVPLTVVGVAPPGFYGLDKSEAPDVWVPLRLQVRLHYNGSNPLDSDRGPVDMHAPWITQAGIRWLNVVARVSTPSRAAEIAAATTTIERREEAPWLAGADAEARRRKSRDEVWLVPGSKGLAYLSRELAQPLRLLLGMAGLVLLIACADIALLLLARGVVRRRDWAVRLALGAGRGRILRRELIGALALALSGAGLGLLLALAGRHALLAVLGTSLPPAAMALDARVLGVCVVAALITGLLFGLGPALGAARVNMSEVLKRGDAGSTGLAGWHWLIGGQLALSLTLLLAAALLSFSLVRLLRARSGLAVDEVVVARVVPGAGGYTAATLPALDRHLRSGLATLPGAQAAALAFSGLGNKLQSTLSIESAGVRHAVVQEDFVSPGFFGTLGMPLLRGRGFTEADSPQSPWVVVVNQTFVRRFLAGGRALGTAISDMGAATIVGVVPDARVNGSDRPVPPMVYHPLVQQSAVLAYEPSFVAVRFAGEANGGIAEVRRALMQIAPTMPVRELTTLRLWQRAGLSGERALAGLSGAFALLALLLAGLGVYGVMSYAAVHRERELGIRMALGARPGQILGLVLRSALGVVAVGMAAGIAAGLPLMLLLRSELHGLSPLDPEAFAAALGLLGLTALLAAWLPAQRAARLAPARALRDE